MSQYGFVKISRDVKQAIPNPGTVKPHVSTELPQSKLATAIYEYSKARLPQPTFNHSLRVYLYCKALIADHFPQWDLDLEVVYVTCLLHDIGTTAQNMADTKMSFEFYGGYISRELVLSHTQNKDYADAVAEAIIRHQDLGDSGYITTLGLIIQLATILDNVGLNNHLIHADTLDVVNKKFSREGWLSCFAKAIDNENATKPWGHTSKLGVDKFRNDVLSNKLAYEKL
jgi:cyanamide hydratase